MANGSSKRQFFNIMFEVYKKPRNSGNYIVTTVCGEEYLNSWEEHALPLWQKYADRHNLGIIALTDEIISKEDEHWKKVHWQKLLILSEIENKFDFVKNVCLLDSDILINPFAPDIFDQYTGDYVGLVSLRNNLPYPYTECLKRISYFRHNCYSSSYPLDSGIFISLEGLYKYHNLDKQEDEACTGVILFNVKNHAALTKSWFYKYDKGVETITNGGEQTHLNYEIQSNCNVKWLDYRFQAIWVYEMAYKYPFLYCNPDANSIQSCIEASLMSNYFLHFAGSWHESKMWTMGNIFKDHSFFDRYYQYLDEDVTGKPLGMIKPA